MNMLITNGLIFTNDAEGHLLPSSAVAIKNTSILELGPVANLRKKYPDFEELDAGGKLIMPGWINAHTHFYSAFGRGIRLESAPSCFPEILKNLWWRLDQALDEDGVYYSALTGAISAIKNGVTSVIDHHASPNAIEGSLSHIQRALQAAGLRGILCYEITDRNGHDQALAGLQENSRFIEYCRQQKKGDDSFAYKGMVGLHASFTLNDETLDAAANLARSLDAGCHFHLAEDKVDQWYIQDKLSSTARMHQHGILGKKSLAIHGVHVSERDMDLLTETNTMMVHSPRSNMNNAVGRADIGEILSKKIILGLGTDGMSQNILPDLQTAFLLNRYGASDPRVGWAETRRMILQNNPRIFFNITGKQVGVIRAGAPADVILLKYNPPAPMTKENFWGHVLYGFDDAKVDTVIINGKMALRNGQFPHIDENEVYAKSRECAKKTWQRFEEIS